MFPLKLIVRIGLVFHMHLNVWYSKNSLDWLFVKRLGVNVKTKCFHPLSRNKCLELGVEVFPNHWFWQKLLLQISHQFYLSKSIKGKLCVGKKAIYPLPPDAQFKFVIFFDILMAKKCNFKNRHWNQNSPLFSVESKKELDEARKDFIFYNE